MTKRAYPNGPWDYDWNADGASIYSPSNGNQTPIMRVRIGHNVESGQWDGGDDLPEDLALIRLVSAAPAMAELLEEMITSHPDLSINFDGRYECRWCGAEFVPADEDDEMDLSACPNPKCPSYRARKIMAEIGTRLHSCDNCNLMLTTDQLKDPRPDIDDRDERMGPAGDGPTGECPICGALTFLHRPEKDREMCPSWRCAECGLVQGRPERPSRCPSCGAAGDRHETLP